jgi:spore coat polysaccharide biosynthesis predicted glycosyltransferase SpsG
MKQYTILSYVDGNNSIGLGHAFRQFNLGKELKKEHFKIFYRTHDKIVKDILSSISNCQYIKKNLSLEKKFIDEINPDLIIIDKLEEKKTFLKMLNKTRKKILAIDYIGLNKNLIENGINILYPKSGIKKALTGFDFAILNKQFKKTKRKLIKKNVDSILILQGGADTYCLLPKIITNLNDIDKKFKITVVVGHSFDCWDSLNKSVKNSPHKIQIKKNVIDMSTLMNKHDLAISAAGMTLLELAFLGIPTVIVCAEKFEEETARLLQRRGFGLNLGFSKNPNKTKLQKSLMILNDSYQLRHKMSLNGKRIVDNSGTKMIVKHINFLIKFSE